jgi:hypothetical protein
MVLERVGLAVQQRATSASVETCGCHNNLSQSKPGTRTRLRLLAIPYKSADDLETNQR